MDTVANFVGNTAKVRAFWNQQQEDRWHLSPPAQQQSASLFEAWMKDESSVIVRLPGNYDKV